MTKRRTGEARMPAGEYGRSLPRLSLNPLVRDVARAVPIYRDVLGATARYADEDFAALSLAGVEFMLQADHVMVADPDGYTWAVGVPLPK